MTISANEAFRSGPYNGNGVTTVFDYEFTIFVPDDLVLTRRNVDGTQSVLVRNTDYTVQGAAVTGGGTVTLVDGDRLPTGTTLVITSNISSSQDRPFSSQSSLSLEEIENALDKLTALVRKLEERGNRSMTVPVDSTISTQLAALPVVGASIVFDEDGNLNVGPTSTQIAGAQAAAMAAIEAAVAAGEDADAAQLALNNLNATLAAAVDAAVAAGTDLAERWASEAEDVPVEGGEFSAKHYAAKAAVFDPALYLPKSDKATTEQAEAGTVPDKWVDPVLTKAAIDAQFNVSGAAPKFACRAWVNFNGTGTVAIVGSGNVSSITDHGVGSYTINFATDLPDANYAAVASAGTLSTSNINGAVRIGDDTRNTKTVSALSVLTTSGGDSARADHPRINVVVMG